jgi:hypothetical protein
MLIDLIPPSKDIVWQTGLKRKIQQSVVYRRPISSTSTRKNQQEDLSSQCPQKQAGVAILISDKVDFKHTLIKQDKEGHFILIKEEIQQKEITIINLCTQCKWTQFHQTYS